MRSVFQRLRVPLGVSLAFAVASGCVARSENALGGFVPLKDAGPGSTTIIVFDSGPRDAQPVSEGGLLIDKLCGNADYCRKGTPDNPHACDGFGSDSGEPLSRNEAGGRPVESSGGARDASEPSDAGQDGGDAGRDAANALPEQEGGIRVRSLPAPEPLPPPPDAGATRYACQVGRDNSGGPVRQCAPSGSGESGAPCNSAGDCAPGFGCIGAANPGQCFPYCCEASTVCGPGTFCAERPLLDTSHDKPLLVPVCAPGEDCALLEPFPCTGSGCTCTDPTTACTVVRADGTRGCVTPGTGKVNDKCPCAAGYYCSLATSLCVKMCKTDGIDDRCDPGKCQAAAGFPTGFGLCVGYAPAVQ